MRMRLGHQEVRRGMRLPRRGVMLTDPGLAEAQLVGPAQLLKIPLVTVEELPLRRVRRHREETVFHGKPPDRSLLQISFEGKERPPPVPEREEPEVGAGHAVTVAEDDVPGDRLESGPEVLARLDQDVLLAARVDPAVGEDPGVE